MNIIIYKFYFQADFYSEDPSNLESLDLSINITDNDKKEEVKYFSFFK